jgi:hypothetical protein
MHHRATEWRSGVRERRVCGRLSSGLGDCSANPPKECSPLPHWFKDADNDGVGGSTSMQSCAAPAGFVSVGGDCLDSNSDVKPTQLQFFATPYINAAGATSYDYDCSGIEEASGQEPRFSGTCNGTCDNYGALPNRVTRAAGAGIDPYCGSTARGYCADNGPPDGCQVQPPTTEPAVTCR